MHDPRPPPNVPVAPLDVFDVITCGSTTDTLSLTAMHGCYKVHLPCKMVCGCQGEVNRRNEHTRRVDIVEDCDSGVVSEDSQIRNVLMTHTHTHTHIYVVPNSCICFFRVIGKHVAYFT
jgi:allantoicase